MLVCPIDMGPGTYPLFVEWATLLEFILRAQAR